MCLYTVNNGIYFCENGNRPTSSFYWAQNKLILILGRPELLIHTLKQAALVSCLLPGDRRKATEIKSADCILLL